MAEAMSVDALPSLRRRRLDVMETQSTTGPSEKYKDLWLEDGNIILQCTDGVFRVHRSLLATQSEVFRGMFTLPATGDSAIPTVALSDEADKMNLFLRCLLLHDDPAEDDPWFADQILDIFELSNKYMIPAVRRSSILALKRLFPDKLEDYQATVGKRRNVVSYAATIRCIALASSHEVLLPACYLHLADHFQDDIFDLKSTTPWPADIPLTIYVAVVRSLKQLLKLKRSLIDRCTRDWLDTWCDGEHKHLIPALLDYFAEPYRPGPQYYEDNLRLFQPESLISKITDITLDDILECDKCLQGCDSHQRDTWGPAWEELPRYLGLDSWEALREEERKVFSAP